jgi:hypothetical protein
MSRLDGTLGEEGKAGGSLLSDAGSLVSRPSKEFISRNKLITYGNVGLCWYVRGGNTPSSQYYVRSTGGGKGRN